MELYEIYTLAKSCTDFAEFEQLIKSKLTGKPVTTVINCEIKTILKS